MKTPRCLELTMPDEYYMDVHHLSPLGYAHSLRVLCKTLPRPDWDQANLTHLSLQSGKFADFFGFPSTLWGDFRMAIWKCLARLEEHRYLIYASVLSFHFHRNSSLRCLPLAGGQAQTHSAGHSTFSADVYELIVLLLFGTAWRWIRTWFSRELQ